ncbi:oxidoreductase [Coralloluteibacterium stylophorae]|uniref:Oxidoreductase n=1 Tax=Coralloluteibacterium stylophorae TaxID=1776034 RepID=A0A8J7VT60_9GAMM|nr:oxidoreductase [Coralloluteibacterium stylophorae]MBS7456285.1 oxidoreductase [Coralloluteibacterium stylophorae]
MTATVNVALVGYGLAGSVFHAPLIRHVPGLHLHTVVSSDAAKVHAADPRARVVAATDEALADPEVGLVVIAAPNHLHAPLSLRALEAGKHVVVDKPFAPTLAEAQAVVAAAEAAGRTLTVFHNRRWDGDFLTLRRLVAAGALGAIAELHSHFDRFRPQVAQRWRERPGAGTGLWFDLGPHLVDQALQLLGMPDAVEADLLRQRPDAEVDDYFHVVLHYPRARVVLHAGSLVAAPAPRFAAHGSAASFLRHGLDPQEDALRRGQTPATAGFGVDPRPGSLVAGDGSIRELPLLPGDYAAFYAGVRDALLHGAPPPVSAAEALAVMHVLEAAAGSAAAGCRVALREA